MSRVRDIVILVVLYSVLIAAAVAYPSAAPYWILTGIAAAVAIYLHRRSIHSKRVEQIHNRLSNLRSAGLFIDGSFEDHEDTVFYRMIITLLTDLERTLFKLVEKNIQLLSLKEIGRNIISSMDEKKLIESVFDYLVHGVGYKEAAFFLLRRKKGCLQAVVTIEKSTRVIRRVMNFGVGDIEGAILNSLKTGKAFLIKDVRMHPLMTVQGEDLFPGSTMTSYICVPLMKSGGSNDDHPAADCPVAQREDASGGVREITLMTADECLSCPENPVLGALIVTDGYRATPLTNIDQVTVETVGSLVGSNIENWLLYQELRQEELFREKVFEGMMHGLVVASLDGSIGFANRSAREMSGYATERIYDLDIDDLIMENGAEDDSTGESMVRRLLEGVDALAFRENYLRRSDGALIPIRMNVSRLVGDDGETQGAIVLFADMSDIKKMEERIRYLDRLAALGRFTSAIAHEIRNPLTGIAAGIQYLDRSRDLDEEQKESISFILNEVDRLNRIITDLFKVAKPRDLLYQQTDITSVFEKSVRSLGELLAEKEIGVEYDIREEMPAVELDPDQITQVLINLIKNSAEAVERGGKILLRARMCEDDEADILLAKDGGTALIEITDDGPGIDARDRERIFEPFFSRKKGGTGLGLFVTHSIIQHHQGRISVDSEPGKGTVFSIHLPVIKPVKGGKVETGSASGR